MNQVKENLKDCKRRKKIQINALKNKLFFSSEQISEEIKKSPYGKEDLNNLLLAHLQNKDEDMVSVANSIIKNLLSCIHLISWSIKATSLMNIKCRNSFKSL